MTILDKFCLTGKRALITGGSRGIGRAIAQSFSEAGAELVLVGRNESDLQKAQQELPGDVEYITCDLFDAVRTEEMCRKALADKSIHILVNNVGGRRVDSTAEKTPLKEWLYLMNLNLTSVFLCTKFLGTPMTERGSGRIINIASTSGMIVPKDLGGRHYEAAKGAVISYTRAMAADWASRGVTVNAIAPGWIDTRPNYYRFLNRPEYRKEVESWIPMGRFGKPEEVGSLALFLASESSSYITGAVIPVDGGYILW